MMLRTQTPIPCRTRSTSPRSTAVSMSYVDVANHPITLDELGCGSSKILQSRPAATSSLYADAVRQDVAYRYVISPSPSPPPPLLLGVPQAAAGLDVALLHQTTSVLVRVPVVHGPLAPTTSAFCQEIQPTAAVTHAGAAVVNSDSSSQGASPHVSAASAPPRHSRKSKDFKTHTALCRNGPGCNWLKKNNCDYAHSEEELRRFFLSELREANNDKDYLVNVCLDHVMNGYW